MAQKINPIILRLEKTNLNFDSCWYTNSNYVNLLMNDIKVQNYINCILKKIQFSSARFLIQNLHNKVKINVFFCNPTKNRNYMSEVLRIKNYKKVNKPEKKLFTKKYFLISKKQNKIYNYLNKSLVCADLKALHEKTVYKNLNNCVSSPIKYITEYEKNMALPLNADNAEILNYSSESVKTVSFPIKSEKKKVKHEFSTTKQNKNADKHESGMVLNNYLKYSSTIEKLNEIYIKYFLIKFFSINVAPDLNLYYKLKKSFKSLYTSQDVCCSKRLCKVHFLFYKKKQMQYTFFLNTKSFLLCRRTKQKKFYSASAKNFLFLIYKKKLFLSLTLHKMQDLYSKKLFADALKNNFRKNNLMRLQSLIKFSLPLSYKIKKPLHATSFMRTVKKPENLLQIYKKKVLRCLYITHNNNLKKYKISSILNYCTSFSKKIPALATADQCSVNFTHTIKKLGTVYEKLKNYIEFKCCVRKNYMYKLMELSHLPGKLNFPFVLLPQLDFHTTLLSEKMKFNSYSSFSKPNKKNPRVEKTPSLYYNINFNVLKVCNKINDNKQCLFKSDLKYVNSLHFLSANCKKTSETIIKDFSVIPNFTMVQKKTKYIFLSLISNQYLSKTYNDYCHLSRNSAFHAQTFILKKKQLPENNFVSVSSKATPKQCVYKAESCIDTLNPGIDSFTTILIASPPYKQHIESIVHENFKRSVSLQFFKNTNIFQSAVFLLNEIVYYLEKKVSFFKLKNIVLKKLTQEKNLKIKGIRVMCSGRVGGKSKKAQKAKIQNFKYGETSLHVFSCKIDFKAGNAFTNFGTLGIKVWICYA